MGYSSSASFVIYLSIKKNYDDEGGLLFQWREFATGC